MATNSRPAKDQKPTLAQLVFIRDGSDPDPKLAGVADTPELAAAFCAGFNCALDEGEGNGAMAGDQVIANAGPLL